MEKPETRQYWDFVSWLHISLVLLGATFVTGWFCGIKEMQVTIVKEVSPQAMMAELGEPLEMAQTNRQNKR